MNVAPMIFPLGLRIRDAREPRQEEIRGVDEVERQLQTLEARPHLRGFVLPQETVVDEDARQPIADRTMDEHRGDRRVHAAR